MGGDSRAIAAAATTGVAVAQRFLRSGRTRDSPPDGPREEAPKEGEEDPTSGVEGPFVAPRLAGRALLRAIGVVRSLSREHAVAGARAWSSCEPLALVETGAWDPFHLLLFLFESHLRVCVAKIFSDGEGWGSVVGKSLLPSKRTLDGESDAFDDAPFRDAREALERGLVPRGVSVLVGETPFCRTTAALVVCLDGVVPEGEREAEAERGMFDGTRPTRLGVRLLERQALATDAADRLAEQLDETTTLATPPPEEGVGTKALETWTRRTIEVEANNALLLRMDEWAVVAELRPALVAYATGERGAVPHEHRNSPAAWVAQRALPDEAYRDLMARAKKNVDHAANAYVCFSGMLEQHYAFDWLTRCFASRLHPVGTLRKVREYLRSARSRTAPLVVESTGGKTVVLYRSAARDGFERVECATPYEAIDAWIRVVRTNAGGVYTRKANVEDVVERVRRPPELEKPEENVRIGGASIEIK